MYTSALFVCRARGVYATLAVACALLLALAWLDPTVASAAPGVTSVSPASLGQVVVYDPAVSATLSTDGGATLNPGAMLYIDGVPANVQVAYASGGYWAEEDGYPYWVPGSDPSKGTVSRTAVALATGTHTARVVASDTLGRTIDYSWTFSVNLPAIMSAPSPALNATVTVARPSFSVYLARCPLSTITATIDGASATVGLNSLPGRATVVPATSLTDGSDHVVKVRVTDAAGRDETTTWTVRSDWGAAIALESLTPPDGATVSSEGSPLRAVLSAPAGVRSVTARVDVTDLPVTTTSIDGVTRVSAASTIPALAAGPHSLTIVATAADGSSKRFATAFTCAEVPRLSDGLPVPGSTVATRTPAISAAVQSAGSVVGTFTINGTRYAATYDAGTGRLLAPAVTLADITTAEVTVTAAPVAGGAAGTMSWTFDVRTAPDAGDCTVCHDASTHPMRCNACHHVPGDGTPENCTTCHVGIGHGPEKLTGRCQSCHQTLTTPAFHGPYSVSTHTAAGLDVTVSAGGSAGATCADCHAAEGGLASQHVGVGPADGSPYGTTVTCPECHNDTRANGAAQVAASWATDACSDCHTAASSAPMHATRAPVVDTTSSAGCASSGAGCHATSDVHAIHKNASGGCTIAGCHDTSQQAAKPALKTCGQTGGCHATEGVDFHTHGGSAHTASVGVQCTTCHRVTNLKTTHVDEIGLSCATCHQSADPKVTAAIRAGDSSCVACHDLTGHPAQQQHFNSFAGTSSTRAAWYWPTLTADTAGTCATCHDGTFKTTRVAGNDLCFTCHDAEGKDLSGYGYPGKAVYTATAHAADPAIDVSQTTLPAFASGTLDSIAATAGPPPSFTITTRNLALGKTYTVSPRARVLSLTGGLTNSDSSMRAVTWMSWYDLEPSAYPAGSAVTSVTIDLGTTTEVGAARLYSGISVSPQQSADVLAVFVSQDNVSWSQVGSVGTLDAPNGDLYVSFAARQARYVRFDVTKWCDYNRSDTRSLTLTECEVYPPSATGTWTSPTYDLSDARATSKATIAWTGSVPSGGSVAIDTDVSFDGGSTWTGWQEAPSALSGTAAAIPQLPAGTKVADARLKYRARLTRSASSGRAPVVTRLDARVGLVPNNAAPVYAGSGTATPGACVNCHNPHGTPGSGNVRAAGNELCFGCHDVAGLERDATYKYKGRGAYAGSGHSAQSCVGCHAPHGAAGVSASGLLAQADQAVCLTCHSAAQNSANGVNVAAKFAASPDPSAHHGVTAAEQSAGGTKVACGDCHQPHVVSATSPISDPASGASFTAKRWAPEDMLVMRPIDDIQISSATPGLDTAGLDHTMEASITATNFETRSLLKYDLTRLSGRRVKKATLRIFRYASSDVGRFVINPMTKDWEEVTPTSTKLEGASWNFAGLYPWDYTVETANKNRWATPGGDFDRSIAASFSVDATARQMDVDVTALLAWAQARPNYGFVVRPEQRPAWLTMDTDESELHPDRAPTLIVEFEDTVQKADDISFCLSCHGDAGPPVGVKMGVGLRSIGSFVGLDHHGSARGDGGSSNSGNYDFYASLQEPYYYGYDAISCQTCHDPHGSTNPFHLKDQMGYRQTGGIAATGEGAEPFCSSCHNSPHHATSPETYGSQWKNCFSCHHHGTAGYF